MGWFSKKPKKPDPVAEQFQQLANWRPVGAHFWYLGRDCVVTAHGERRFYLGIGEVGVPGIHADYADNNGVLHNVSFRWSESVAIMEANP